MKAIDKTLYQIDIKCKSSKHGGEMYEITFVDTDGEVYVTYAVPGYENYAERWKFICDNQDDAVTIKNASQKTKYGKPQYTKYNNYPIIDCDSETQAVAVQSMKAQLKEIYSWFK